MVKKNLICAWGVISVLFSFVPESCFDKHIPIFNTPAWADIIIARCVCYIVIFAIIMVIYWIYLKTKTKVVISGKNYTIQVEYGDLLQQTDCKKVITFDECFTTHIGSAPEDINKGSLCGQYLIRHSGLDINSLISTTGLKPARGKSKWQGKIRYESGRLLPNGDDLLMAFAKLDSSGSGILTYEEYVQSLNILWKEISKHYGQMDVCIPILGSGVTRMGATKPTQQELLDIIINSYILSPYKIDQNYKLRIMCMKKKDFSISNIRNIKEQVW